MYFQIGKLGKLENCKNVILKNEEQILIIFVIILVIVPKISHVSEKVLWKFTTYCNFWKTIRCHQTSTNLFQRQNITIYRHFGQSPTRTGDTTCQVHRAVKLITQTWVHLYEPYNFTTQHTFLESPISLRWSSSSWPNCGNSTARDHKSTLVHDADWRKGTQILTLSYTTTAFKYAKKTAYTHEHVRVTSNGPKNYQK